MTNKKELTNIKHLPTKEKLQDTKLHLSSSFCFNCITYTHSFNDRYRVAICGEENLPNIEFLVIDSNRNIIYSSKDNNYSKTWDFKLQSSQQLKFVIKIDTAKQAGRPPTSGCVSIMFGFNAKK